MPLCGYNEDMANGLRIFAGGFQEGSKAGMRILTQTQPKLEDDMTFCGHNESMALGIGRFSGGLAAQTRKRAEEEGLVVGKIPAVEIEEINTLLTELNSSPKRDGLGGIIAIGLLIRFFYATLEAKLAKNPSLPIEGAFREIVEELNRLLFAMEAHYYEELRPNLPRLEAIRRIRSFLEAQVE